MKTIPYNRKINAPLRFLYYLEVFDLFVITVLGFLVPLGVSTFLPVAIPTWHMLLWLVGLTFVLIIIKIGRAPGFIQHWLAQLLRTKSYHPGKRRGPHFLLDREVYQGENGAAAHPEMPFTSAELGCIQSNVGRLRQARREADLMA